MTISSRTPEGMPQRCPICGEAGAIEPSYPGGDSCCAACGSLMWWFRDRLSIASLEFDSALADVGVDSLDVVELVMELEEEYDISISDEEAAEIHTIQDAIRSIRRRRPDEAA